MSIGSFIDPKERTPEMIAAQQVLTKLSDKQRIALCTEVLANYGARRAVESFGKENARRRGMAWQWIAHKKDPHDKYYVGVPAADHCECREKDGERYLISHPYNLCLDEMRDIIRFCEANAVDCWVTGRSWYYPMATLRIVYEDAEQQRRRQDRERSADRAGKTA